MGVNWAQLPPDLEHLIGRTVADRYLLEDVLGVGGMGAVFRGRHLALERAVAIKVLRPDVARHPEVSARFDREAKAASLFDHPNCVRVIDFGSTEDGMKYMVMELIDGRGLVSLLGVRFPPSQAVQIAIQILRGLEHAHGHGVIHRDLKPENVHITHDHRGEALYKLVDFGIAKLVHGRDGIVTRVGTVFGTPHYMSPEQAAGEETDGRADLYSVGVILYQLLTAALPFDDPDTREVMRQQMSAHPPPLPPYVPRAIALVLGRLLAKRRALRYASAGDALAALEAVQAGLPGDRTPRVAVLGPPPDRRGYARDADPALDRVGAALDRVLAQHTPLAMEALRDGIHETPAAPEWTLDPNLDELELDDRDGDGHR